MTTRSARRDILLRAMLVTGILAAPLNRSLPGENSDQTVARFELVRREVADAAGLQTPWVGLIRFRVVFLRVLAYDRPWSQGVNKVNEANRARRS